MKLQYGIGAVASALIAMTSCSMHDPYDDILEVGQALPTVSIELESTVANAGDSVAFKGKYYTDKEHTPDHAEIWNNVVSTESAAATLKLCSALSYTQTVSGTDTVRTSQVVASYPHAVASWNGHEYELNAKFPTSQTLRSITWSSISEWDQSTFDEYYPADFQETFVSTVINYLTQDSTYYDDLRYVYVNYDFTADQINSVIAKYPALNSDGALSSLVLTDSGEKSDIWYTQVTKPGSTEYNVVGKYYIEIVNGEKVYREVATDYVNPDVTLYDVYESSPWLFCRYDDDSGSVITTVRSTYMPVFKDLISLIPFTDWIYNSSDGVYSVEFSRSYSLGVTFKVVDTVGNVGYTTDSYEVSLN